MIDTETTGLLEPEGNDIRNQPYIIEVFVLKTTDEGVEESRYHSLVKPPKPLPEVITKITGLTDAALKDAPPFSLIYRDLVGIFFGAHTMVAHNLSFDLGVLTNELIRIEKQYQFPYPPIHFCTVEQSMYIRGHRLKLQELHQLATGKTEIENAHRAEFDVLALRDCYFWLKEAANDMA
jgi:DNA polymerase III epsilon subunit-like protein